MKFTKRGYVLIYQPKHPFCQSNGWILEHRLVMENHIGRYLNKEERVHHKNGIKTDNRIDNLELFSNHSEHLKYHMSDPKVRKNLSDLGYLRVQSPETREKCRISKLGNKHCVGRVLSEETKRKIAEGIKNFYRERVYATAY